jgi:ketosteroid isomerase-like protein
MVKEQPVITGRLTFRLGRELIKANQKGKRLDINKYLQSAVKGRLKSLGARQRINLTQESGKSKSKVRATHILRKVNE